MCEFSFAVIIEPFIKKSPQNLRRESGFTLFLLIRKQKWNNFETRPAVWS